MFTVPAIEPVTTPVPAPTVAVDIMPLLQVPPGAGLLSVIVWPTHTDDGPVIGAPMLTVTVLVVTQPVVEVKLMTALPVLMPPNTADEVVDEFTTAISVLPLLHVPPPGVLLASVMVWPAHIAGAVVGVIGLSALTVITFA